MGRRKPPIAWTVTGVACDGPMPVPSPELRQLHAFMTVLEAGSVTRGAARLLVSQQSLSEQMRTLEQQLGAPLLVRSNRGVTPTPVGEVLLREARELLGSAERLADVVARAARGDSGRLRVGFLTTVAHDLMPVVVRAFAEHHAEVALQTEDLAIAPLVEGVRNGRLDAALSRPPLVDDVAWEPVADEQVAAVLPAGHRLADRGTASTTRTSRRLATARGWCSEGPRRRPCSRSWRPGPGSRAYRSPRRTSARTASRSCR